MRSPVTMLLTQRGQLLRRTIPTSPARPWEMGQQGPRQGAQPPWSLRRARRRCWGRRHHLALVRCRARVLTGGARARGGLCSRALTITTARAGMGPAPPVPQDEVALSRGGPKALASAW